MKRIFGILLPAFALMSVTLVSCKDDDDNNVVGVNGTDQNFVTMAGYSNRNEISFANLALSKSTNDSVRMFAQHMLAEHGVALMGLDSLGTKYSIAIPDTIDAAHIALKAQLQGMSGYMFDTAYIRGQLRDHDATIALFLNETSNGQAQDVKSYATRTLPHLYEHRQFADSVNTSLH